MSTKQRNKTPSRFPWAHALACTVVLSACGSHPPSDNRVGDQQQATGLEPLATEPLGLGLFSPAQSESFGSWCRDWGLSRCDLLPSQPRDPEVVQDGFTLLGEVLESPSSLNILRSDLELDGFSELIDLVGARPIVDIFGQIPWQSIQKAPRGLELVSALPGSVDYQGLIFVSDSLLKLTWQGEGRFRVRGLSLESAFGASRLDISEIRLRADQSIDLSTRFGKTITGVPLGWFRAEGSPDPREREYDLRRILESLSALTSSPDFNWRERLGLVLRSRQMEVIKPIFLKRVDQADPLANVSVGIVSAISGVIAGGLQSDNVFSVSMPSNLGCTIRVGGVPVLGRINLNLTLARSYGISEIDTQDNGRVAIIRFFGIRTNYGRVRTARLENGELTLRVGSVNVPINLNDENDGGNNGGGTEIISSRCGR